MGEKLLPCIECGSATCRISQMVEVKGERYQVICDSCGAHTSGHRKSSGSAAVWNHFAKIHAKAFQAGARAMQEAAIWATVDAKTMREVAAAIRAIDPAGLKEPT